jgi:hypothetical protein
MSISARNWAWSVTGYTNAEGVRVELHVGAKSVLLCLAEHENAEFGYAFPGQETIAHLTCQSVRSVRTHLKSLEALGAFTLEKRHSARGPWLQNVYVLKVPDKYREEDPEWLRNH